MCLLDLLLFCALHTILPDVDGTVLSGKAGFADWQGGSGEWLEAAKVSMDPENPKRLKVVEEGSNVLVNGRNGKAKNLITKRKYSDIHLSLEFLLPKGANSGVKMHGQYEIQLFDSFGKTTLTGSDCGGIYPRAERLPRYRHIDQGFAPLVNACKPAGEWQTLEIIFQSPRFDARGQKTANARFIVVTLNGQTVQKNVEIPSPTGHVWKDQERSEGPILLQGDHGPVAFRNLRVRLWKAGETPKLGQVEWSFFANLPLRRNKKVSHESYLRGCSWAF